MKFIAVTATILLLGTGTAFGQGDAAAGETTFKKCAICHAVGEGAKNKVGPVLNGVVGRVAGSLEGFNFSQAMKDAGAGGVVWTPETLGQYLHKPKDFVPGTKMAFAGVPDQADVDNLVAYLLTFSPDYVPGEGPAEAPAQ